MALVMYACSKVDDYKDIVSGDTSKPGTVSNVQVTNGAGTAIITYDLPNSENILYVQATYKINDKVSRQIKIILLFRYHQGRRLCQKPGIHGNAANREQGQRGV